MPKKIDIPTLKKLVNTPPEKACDLRDKELRGFIVRQLPSGRLPLYAELGRGKREMLYHEQGRGQRKNKVGKHNVDARDVLNRSKTGISLRWCRQEVKRLQGSGKDYAEERRAMKAIPTWETYREEIYGPWLHDNPNHRHAEETLNMLKARFSEFDQFKLDHITPRDIDTWKHKRLKSGIKPETVNRNLIALKSAFARYAEWNPDFINPLRGYKLIKVDRNKEPVRAFTESEVEALLEALEKREEKIQAERVSANQWRDERHKELLPDLGGKFVDVLRPAVEVSLATGLRRGELFSLTWDRVNFDNSELRIAGEYTKSYDTRNIPLNDNAVSILRKWKLQQGRTRDGLVFPGTNGRLTKLSKSFYKVLQDAGIKRVTGDVKLDWHSLRHTFGTRLGLAGVDVTTLKKLMGHADIKTTQRYLHTEPERMRQAVAMISSDVIGVT